MEKNNKPRKTLGTIIGQAFAVTIISCLAALLVALTVKCIFLMF